MKSGKAIAILLSLSVALIVTFQNCAQNKVNFDVADSTKIGPLDCEFGDSFIHNGQSIEVFLESAVDTNQTCVSQIRTCKDTYLSGEYQYLKCQVGGLKSCKLGKLEILHGQSTVAYQKSSVPFGQDCQIENRTCNNGNLSGSFQYTACSKGAVSSCQLGSTEIINNGQIKAYKYSSVPTGSTCDAEFRVCNNGTLSGSFEFTSCNIGGQKSCLLNELQIPHGGTVQAFSKSAVIAPLTCESEVRTCNNGLLSGSYSYLNCAQNAEANCLLDGKEVVSGTSITAYSNNSVVFGSSCQSIAEQRTCNNGILSGSYQYKSCKVQSAPELQLSAPLVIVKGLDKQIELTWTAVPSAASYVVERSMDNKNYSAINANACDLSNLKCTDTSLVNGTQYYYRIYAKDSNNTNGIPTYVLAKPYAVSDAMYGKAISTLTWSAVDGASYQLKKIHRNSSGVVSESVIYTGSNTSKTDTIDVNNNSYTYIH